MKPTLRFGVLRTGLCLSALLLAAPAWSQNYSHARIVRLSFVEGSVTVQRPEVSEWASAPVNTPLQEGFKVSTGEKSFAEVEFENTSTARLGEFSLLEFNQLALSPAGGKINRLTLHSGYATFSAMPEGDDVNEVKAAGATLIPYVKTTYRLDMDGDLLRISVFKGSVEVSSPYGNGTIAKNTVLEIRPAAEQPFLISQGITKDEWDEWVEQREDALTALRNKRAPSVYGQEVTAPFYGWDDLWNFGNWSYLPGYGYGWAPFAPVGWAPYSYGQWCWYPGFGYTWIPAEPWGWLPFHYGYWEFFPGIGWCWFPGSFAAWSPAMVTWYQGPGWIGWAPRGSISVRRIHEGCPSPQGCTTAVSVSSFQNGKPVTPTTTVAVNFAQGRAVSSPDVPPTRVAMLPGPPHPPGFAPSGVAFDPTTGRFVNSHASAARSSRFASPTSSPERSAGISVNSTAAQTGGLATVGQGARPESPFQNGLVGRPGPVAPPMPGEAGPHSPNAAARSGFPTSAPINSPGREAQAPGAHSPDGSGHHSGHGSSHESSGSGRSGGGVGGGSSGSAGHSSGGGVGGGGGGGVGGGGGGSHGGGGGSSHGGGTHR